MLARVFIIIIVGNYRQFKCPALRDGKIKSIRKRTITQTQKCA